MRPTIGVTGFAFSRGTLREGRAVFTAGRFLLRLCFFQGFFSYSDKVFCHPDKNFYKISERHAASLNVKRKINSVPLCFRQAVVNLQLSLRGVSGKNSINCTFCF